MSREKFLPFGQPAFGPDEEEAVLRVLRSGWVGMGPETIAFEEELRDFIGCREVVTVNSCTSALFLALRVLGVAEHDEVVVPSLTWCSTANAALYLGARPVFCDIDPETLCSTWEFIEPHLTSRTKAVIIVHFGGLAVDTEAIRRKLPARIALVEDAAHAFGARHANGSIVGSTGNLTAFSFYANKNLSTAEGGAIAVDDPPTAEHLRRLRLHGLHSNAWMRFNNRAIFDPQITELGYKMNYTDLQAAIGRVQLRRQPRFQAHRHRIVEKYRLALPSILPGIRWQAGIDDRHAAHLFTVTLPLHELEITRDEFLLALRARNIGAAVHYAPLHLMPLYHPHDVPPSLPNTEKVAEAILTLPISASMAESDADDVLTAVSDIAAKAAQRAAIDRT